MSGKVDHCVGSRRLPRMEMEIPLLDSLVIEDLVDLLPSSEMRKANPSSMTYLDRS